MTTVVRNPTYENASAAQRTLADRPRNLNGTTVGIISNGKAATRPFFDHLEQMLRADWGVAEVVRLTKSNYSAPAESDLIAQAAEWAVMFAGIGD